MSLYRTNPLQTMAAFFLVYVAATGLSLPGATILTLAAGAIFGLLWGTVIVSFASSIGATLAFLASRYLLRDSIQAKFGDKLKAINAGIEKDGAFYLFTLRLVPAFPFFVINLVMGLTSIKTRTFYWVSQLGMLAGTIVYVNAGTQIAQIESAAGILSPALIASFTLLGIFPLIAKKIVAVIKARKVYSRFTRPRKFDRNVIVIGAGSAGLVSAYIAAAVKAKVTLIEKAPHGRRLPQYRLRALQGADPFREIAVACQACAGIRRARGQGDLPVRRRDGARATGHQGHRAARFRGALHEPGRGVHQGRGKNNLAVGSAGQR